MPSRDWSAFCDVKTVATSALMHSHVQKSLLYAVYNTLPYGKCKSLCLRSHTGYCADPGGGAGAAAALLGARANHAVPEKGCLP